MDDFLPTDDEWQLLHELRLRGFVPFAEEFERLVENVFVVHKAKLVAFTPQGRAAHESWARYELGTETHASAQRLHDNFDPLNKELLTVCSAWQVRPGGAPNDHTDATYDWQVIDRLDRLHEKAAPRIRRLARDATRFERYDRTLRTALRKIIDDGATEWFTSPRIDSYHTVWNQLHEDLLLALGIDRNA